MQNSDGSKMRCDKGSGIFREDSNGNQIKALRSRCIDNQPFYTILIRFVKPDLVADILDWYFAVIIKTLHSSLQKKVRGENYNIILKEECFLPCRKRWCAINIIRPIARLFNKNKSHEILVRCMTTIHAYSSHAEKLQSI